MNKKIGVIGCGNMGSAVIKAVTRSPGHQVTSFDSDKTKIKRLAKKYKFKIAKSSSELAKECDVIVLAVKPKDITAVLQEIKSSISSSKLLISIAAGVTTGSIEKTVGGRPAVIRVMPNMPALIGDGISAVCRGRFAGLQGLKAAEGIFMKLGDVVEVKENLMDAVTAISGSGPAYFFYIVEILIKCAIDMGLKKEVARKLAVQTALGSAGLLKVSGETPEALRAKVTSKGGTTEAAFKVLNGSGVDGIFKKAIAKAQQRAKQLR